MAALQHFDFGICEGRSGDFVARVGEGISTSAALLEGLRVELRFPAYFGANWNALSDCLRDLGWIEERTVVLCHADLPALPARDLRQYLEVLAQAVTDWREGEAHALRVVFPEGLRAAVDAALR